MHTHEGNTDEGSLPTRVNLTVTRICTTARKEPVVFPQDNWQGLEIKAFSRVILRVHATSRISAGSPWLERVPVSLVIHSHLMRYDAKFVPPVHPHLGTSSGIIQSLDTVCALDGFGYQRFEMWRST
jgi:hypothetical protein